MARAEIGQRWRNSRYARRHISNLQRGHDELTSTGLRLDAEMRAVNEIVEQVRLEHNANPASMAYRGKPTILKQVDLIKERGIHINRVNSYHIQHASSSKFNPDLIYHAQENDIYTSQIKGVSLEDMNGMKLPLKTEDIKRISNLFKRDRFSKSSKKQDFVAYSLLQLATVPLAQREAAGHMPESIKHLAEVSQAFFDYYVRFLKESTGTSDGDIMIWASFLRRAPMLLPAIGTYLPARLGITPSSARKLYETHLEFTDASNRAVGKRFERFFVYDLKNAYPNSVPEDLRRYILYDENQDTQATRGLLEHYKPIENDVSAEENQARKQALQEFLIGTKPRLASTLRSAGRFSYSVEGETPIANITVIEPYAHSAMFILNLKNGSHLTLEIGADGDVYGIPAALYKEFPHIEDVLIPDVLRCVRLPEKEKVAPITSNMRSFTPKPLALPSREVAVEQIPHAPKRHVLRRFIPVGKPEEQERLPQQTEAIQHFISYTSDSIRELLGNKKDPNIVKKVEDALFRFERGWKRAKPLEAELGSSRERASIVAGDIRIIIKHQGNHRYELVSIGDREDVYERL